MGCYTMLFGQWLPAPQKIVKVLEENCQTLNVKAVHSVEMSVTVFQFAWCN